MVSGTPAQGKHISASSSGSSMWAVVVLGLITAVFAWVWFGGRGEKRRSEAQDKAGEGSLSADTVQETGPNEPEGSPRKERQVTALTSQPANAARESNTQSPKSPGNTQPENTPNHGAAGEANLSKKGNEQNPIDAKEGQGNGVCGQDESLNKSHKIEAQIASMDLKRVAGEGMLTNKDVCHLKASEQEVQISQDTQAKKELAQTRVNVQQSTSLSPSAATDKELVGAGEEVYPFAGDKGVQISVKDLKPSVDPQEKLVQSSEDMINFIVSTQEVPFCAEVVTDLMHLDHVHDDGVMLINGSEDPFQEENSPGNFMTVNALDINVSPKQDTKSSSENILNQYDCKSFEPSSKIDLTGDEKPLATLESAAIAQVNGDLAHTNNILPEACHAEVSIPQKIENDVILTNQTSSTVDKCSILTQEEESPDFIGSNFGDDHCFAVQSEAKLYDLDSQKTKRVAAVQPIPQNVSLGFKVHYITHSSTQMIAVIGDHEKLGEWENYVPLSSDKDSYWSQTVTLPADANMEWKFVMVESGKIKRWEECNNRHLRTAHEDIATQQWWGYP
ncbi:starch-binding domain-containing protein 1 [Mantella aurantiaca]